MFIAVFIGVQVHAYWMMPSMPVSTDVSLIALQLHCPWNTKGKGRKIISRTIMALTTTTKNPENVQMVVPR